MPIHSLRNIPSFHVVHKQTINGNIGGTSSLEETISRSSRGKPEDTENLFTRLYDKKLGTTEKDKIRSALTSLCSREPEMVLKAGEKVEKIYNGLMGDRTPVTAQVIIELARAYANRLSDISSESVRSDSCSLGTDDSDPRSLCEEYGLDI